MILFLTFLACGSPTHLQYDFGRSFYAAQDIQANTARSTVIDEVYPLNGVEGAGIRSKSVEATTTAPQKLETAEPTQ